MSTEWTVILGLFVGVYALKAAGPVFLGGRQLPRRIIRLTTVLPAALLAGLVATSTFADGRSLQVDARLVGVLTAAVALSRRASFVVVVLVAAAATALTRALIGG